MPKLALHWQILIAILLAIVAGFLSGTETGLFGVTFLSAYEFVGTLFINALKMLIVPLIMSSLIVGVGNLGRSGGGALGRIGFRTVFFYAVSVTTAVLAGLVLVNWIEPGIIDGQPARDLLALEASAAEAASKVKSGSMGDLVQLFVRMVPTNVVQAAVENEMLAIIFFSLVFGFFMTRVEGEKGAILARFWEGVFDVMMLMTGWVMRFAPIGVFGLVAAVVAKTGFAAAEPLVLSALTVVAGLTFHMLVTLPLMLYLIARVNPWRFYQATAPAMLTAFSTASSNAALPVNMECVEHRVGVSSRTTSFVLPLGATVNMDGSALYECVAAIFIAQAYGLELSFGTQFVIVMMAVVTSVGVAGIPAASLVAITIILTAIGLPVEAIAVLFVFDRVLDMLRTSVNITGDGVCAVIVAKLEGEQTHIDLGGPARPARA